MKPLNSHTTGCDPVSSNCVIWQGPDIPCIKLCKGDSVSDVVYKLATELCTVLESLDVSTYDLPNACFSNQACNPGDFHELIQLIIYKICCIESSDPTSGTNANSTGSSSSSGSRLATTSSGCPDCTVDIASCFYYTNEFGDQITTMQLTDYTKAIGNRICTIINDIITLTDIVNNHEERITALENTPAPTLLLPTVTPTCVITPALPQPMNVVLSTLEQQFCQLVSATGTPTNIYQAVTRQCLNLGNSPALGTSGGNMSGIPGWLLSANTMAATINNIWLSICDLRSAVQNIQINCCPSGCDGIAITLNAIANPTSMVVYINGTIPSGFQECDPTGNTFRISDSLGNSITVKINTLSYLNNPTGYTIDLSGTPINTAANLTITSDVCYVNGATNTTCQFCLTYDVINVSICPSITTYPDASGTGVGVTYFPSVVPASYTVEVWDSGFTAVVATQTTAVTTGSVQNVTFSGILSPSTTYNVRLVINNGGKTTECGFATFTTNPVLCLAPSSVSATIALPVYCDTCGPAIDFVSNPAGDGLYVDDTSQYLIVRSGGTFNNIFSDNYAAAMPGIPFPATVSARNSVTTPDGKTYISYNDNSAASASIIYRYDNTGTLQNTITLPFSGATSLRCNNMVYSEFDGKVYFMSWANGTLGTTTKLCMLDPATDTVTSTFTTINAAIAAVFPAVFANPVNGVLYIVTNVVTIKVVNPATDTVITTLADSGYIQVNKDNGDFWVMANTLNTINVYDINNVLLGTAAAPAGLSATTGSANGGVFPLTYYPGDGTVGSERMFGIFNDVGPVTSNIVEFEVSGGFTSSVFTSIPYTASPKNIKYSESFNKLFFTYGTTLEAYAPTDGTTTYANITVGGTNLMWPWEDTTNQQMVYFNLATTPTNNIFWIGLDTTNASLCAEGIVNMYLGNDGPYEFNPGTSSWDNMCTPSAVNVSGTTFQANATFSTSVLFGALLYSTDAGVTWTVLTDTGGNIYANPAAWLAGRTYTYPTGSLMLKITFNTNDSCALESAIFYIS